jgi:hypothetical protein
MKKTHRGPLAGYAVPLSAPLYIKPRPTVFEGTYYAVGLYHTGIPGVNFLELQKYSRERDARRALRNIGYIQEGNRWVHSSVIENRKEAAHAD